MLENQYPLLGACIIIVEPCYLIAWDFRSDLKKGGATIAGPVSTPWKALRWLQDGVVDAALMTESAQAHESADEFLVCMKALALPVLGVGTGTRLNVLNPRDGLRDVERTWPFGAGGWSRGVGSLLARQLSLPA